MNKATTNILIADDHPIVLQGMLSLLKEKGFHQIASFQNGIEAYNYIIVNNPAVCILDMKMPGMTGLEIAEKVLKKNSNAKIVLLTMYKELSLVKKCRSIGIKGYLIKEFAIHEIEQCLENILNDKEYYSKELNKKIIIDSPSENELSILSPSERKILKLIADRKTSKEIAAILFISEKTVEKHRSNIIQKMDLPNDKRSLIELAIKFHEK